MEVSELEKQRLANIQRNAELLKKLELTGLGNDMASDARKIKQEKANKLEKAKRRRRNEIKKETPEVVAPRRKSARIAGIKLEDNEAFNKEIQMRQEIEDKHKEEERARKEGEMKLGDIVKSGDWDSAMSLMSNFGDRVSLGDFFEHTIIDNPDLQKAREELSNLAFDESFAPYTAKLTTERIMGLAIHPAVDKRLVVCGDKEGELGIWDVLDTSKTDTDGDPMPQISTFKVHSRSIARIHISPHEPQKAYTGSYDGSIRMLDLASMTSVEKFVYDSDPRNPIGVSDFHLIEGSSNLMYFTTLQGNFGIHDMREKATAIVKEFELHEKKIGGFAVNPNDSYQIATASLDRTLKIWDLRNYSHLEETSPPLYGEYSSRLSVSCADWSKSGHIVCNGYDDSINVFDMSNVKNLDTKEVQDLKPKVRIKHNCRTGKWVSILKANWHQSPQDGVDKFVIANMNRYVDIYSASGQQLAHLGHPSMTAVPAVVRFHPSLNWLAGANASGKVYIFAPEKT